MENEPTLCRTTSVYQSKKSCKRTWVSFIHSGKKYTRGRTGAPSLTIMPVLLRHRPGHQTVLVLAACHRLTAAPPTPSLHWPQRARPRGQGGEAGGPGGDHRGQGPLVSVGVRAAAVVVPGVMSVLVHHTPFTPVSLHRSNPLPPLGQSLPFPPPLTVRAGCLRGGCHRGSDSRATGVSAHGGQGDGA